MSKPLKLLSFVTLITLTTLPAFADTHVNGYMRRDGTYVQPHWRSESDGSRANNYSTRGNVNPYTGRAGSVDPWNNSYYGR